MVDKDIIKHLPGSFQAFYEICKDAGIEIPGKIEEKEKKKDEPA